MFYFDYDQNFDFDELWFRQYVDDNILLHTRHFIMKA